MKDHTIHSRLAYCSTKRNPQERQVGHLNHNQNSSPIAFQLKTPFLGYRCKDKIQAKDHLPFAYAPMNAQMLSVRRQAGRQDANLLA